MTERDTKAAGAVWPALPLEAWQGTYATLHLYTQVVGKVRLCLAPMQNHYWQVALYLTPRGLTTGPVPYGQRTFAIDLDFISHQVVIRTSDGASRVLPLVPRSVSAFYREMMAALRDLGVHVEIHTKPNEVVEAIPFEEDQLHAEYDPEYANRCWRVLAQGERVLQQFRSSFLGKCSPVHFFWGSFDLAVTRFSGRPAPPHPGGVPNLPDSVAREAYSHEVISHGFWPGGGGVEGPAFYAYAVPEPSGFREAAIRPEGAFYHPQLGEYLLMYEAMRAAEDPDEALLEFCRSTYVAGANLGGWDRAALERDGVTP